MDELRKGYQEKIREDLLAESAAGENKIKLRQEYFQKKDGLPVHLKGSYRIPLTRPDHITWNFTMLPLCVYTAERFLLWGVGIGCIATIGCIGLMATNNLPKKER